MSLSPRVRVTLSLFCSSAQALPTPDPPGFGLSLCFGVRSVTHIGHKASQERIDNDSDDDSDKVNHNNSDNHIDNDNQHILVSTFPFLG
ncbi:hypothetical protein HGM15179_013637 [Zosterops borbonicus]|uniref:Secreted protein n=1 Tax=Zosterops borbonicus TaxID=364589 RepID=A0A8K1LGT7_9PASS|nr:hypothetical protein HGM15179_013637 [Zosterops borbonicus]